MSSSNEKILIITNLYPVPWAMNRASFNKQQFDYLSNKKSVNYIILLPWTEWLTNRKKASSNNTLKYCPYFYVPKVGRRLVPYFQLFSLCFYIPWIKKIKPSVLYSAWAFPDSVAVAMLNKVFKLPFFVKVHGTDVNENTQFPYRQKLIKKWLSKADKIFCPSNALARKLKETGIPEGKLLVNYNGVNSDVFFPSITKIKHKIVFVGNLIPTKGLIELIDAFVSLKVSMPTLSLSVIGEGRLKGTLQKKIQEKQLNVQLKGSMPLTEVAEEIKTSELLVLPSYREGVPNVVLEAFACGVPVVATNVGGIPEVVSDSVGVLVEPQSSSELVKAIESAMSKDWNAQEIVKHSQRFSWKDNVQFVLDSMESK